MTDTLRATRPDHADTTGIYVRAVGLNGRWGSHDIAELDAPSLLAWLRSHDGMAENVVDGDRMRMVSAAEGRALMSFPDDYRLPADERTAWHLVGNSVAPKQGADIIEAVARAA